VADGVHAAVHEMQAPAPDAPINRLRTETEVRELAPGYDTMLRSRKRGDLAVHGAFTSHMST
jgi:hypothetical protein